MYTTEKKTRKLIYICPEIVFIELDNEISLVLESNPPYGPGETAIYTVPENFNYNHFNSNNV